MTMNFRALRNFLELRGHKSAQWEIRGLAIAIYKIVKQEFKPLRFMF
jgi:thymidylate synthase ThyX